MAGDLDRARSLKAQFERAAAEQKDQEQLKDKAAVRDQTAHTRRTSAAKVYVPDTLSRARSIAETFGRAASGAQPERQEQHRDPQRDARRHSPTPAPTLRPSPSLARGSDARAFARKQALLRAEELAKHAKQPECDGKDERDKER